MIFEIEVAPGELVDKLTILEIKLAHVADEARRDNVEREYAMLRRIFDAREVSPALNSLKAELRAVNETLWEIEDAIRDQERRQDFGAEFVRLARGVYKTNDERSRIKREINLRLNSLLIEEKLYKKY